jgi:hypothetical protein
MVTLVLSLTQENAVELHSVSRVPNTRDEGPGGGI